LINLHHAGKKWENKFGGGGKGWTRNIRSLDMTQATAADSGRRKKLRVGENPLTQDGVEAEKGESMARQAESADG